MSSGLDYKWYTYTAEDGTLYNVKIDKAIGDNAAFGFTAFNATQPNLGRGPHMRAVYGISPDGNRTKRPVGTSACDIWTGTATTFDVPVRGSATARTYTVTGKVGERKWHIAHVPVNL